jgi:hypothetical protein
MLLRWSESATLSASRLRAPSHRRRLRMSDTGTGHKSRNEPVTSTWLACRVEACNHRKPSGQPVLPDPAPKQTRHKRHLCPATQAAMCHRPDKQPPASDDSGRTSPCARCRLTPELTDRRRKRALAANPASEYPAHRNRSAGRRFGAVHVRPGVADIEISAPPTSIHPSQLPLGVATKADIRFSEAWSVHPKPSFAQLRRPCLDVAPWRSRKSKAWQTIARSRS